FDLKYFPGFVYSNRIHFNLVYFPFLYLPQAHQFYPLVQINCSEDLRFFLCSIYTPICIDGFPSFLPPCRSICERVQAGCAPVMQHYNFPWPERLNCAQFPKYNNPEGVLCMERNLTEADSSVPIHNSTVSPFVTHRRMATTPTDFNTRAVKQPISTSVVTAKQLTKVAFNTEATDWLRAFDQQNQTIKTILEHRPELRLSCTCNCPSPMMRLPEKVDSYESDKLTGNGAFDCEMPCHSPYFSVSFPSTPSGFMTFWLAIWSTLCALSTMVTISTFLMDSYRFQYPELPIVYLSICYFMVSIGYLIRVLLGHESIACDVIRPDSRISYSFSNPTESDDTLRWTTSSPPLAKTTTAFNWLQAPTTTAVPQLRLLRHALTGRASCAAVFLLTYYFGIASAVWWVVLTLTWFLAAGLKWGSEAISKYSQVFHFIAWTIPTGLTGLAILLAAVEGDPYTGLCMIGTSRRFSHILFQFAPIAMLLATGILFLTIGFIALFRIRGAIKLHRMGLHKADRLENLMIRIGVFGLLYTIPNTIVLMCIGYELQNSRAWELGLACDCKYTDISASGEVNNIPFQWTPPKPNPSIFLLKHFMNLFIGVTCGFWIWSHKTVESWRGLCWQRCFFIRNNRSGTLRLLTSQPHADPDGSSKVHLMQWTKPKTESQTWIQTRGSDRITEPEIDISKTAFSKFGANSMKPNGIPARPDSLPVKSSVPNIQFETGTPKVDSYCAFNERSAMPTVANRLVAPPFISNNNDVGCDFFVTGLASRLPSGMRTSASHASGFQTSPNKSVAMFRGTNWSALSSSGIGSGNGANLSFDVIPPSYPASLSTELSDCGIKMDPPESGAQGWHCPTVTKAELGITNHLKNYRQNLVNGNYTESKNRGTGNDCASQQSSQYGGYYQSISSNYTLSPHDTQPQPIRKPNEDEAVSNPSNNRYAYRNQDPKSAQAQRRNSDRTLKTSDVHF
ncbi:Frizzled/Smoothened family membrane region, partial [Paragonimus heterotremus]